MRDAETGAAAAPKPPASSSGTHPRVEPPPPSSLRMRQDVGVPVLFDDDDEGLDPTRLTSRAQPPSAKSVAIVTRGAASIVASLVTETLASLPCEDAPAEAPRTGTTTAVMATVQQPVTVEPTAVGPVVTPVAAPTPAPMPRLVFPEWASGTPAYALPQPERISDRALAMIVAGSVTLFLGGLGALIWSFI